MEAWTAGSRQVANVTRLFSPKSAITSSHATNFFHRRGLVNGCDHHGPPNVNFWQDPISPSKRKEELVLAVKSHRGHGIETSSSKSRVILRYTAHALKSQNEIPEKPFSSTEEYINGGDTSVPIQQDINGGDTSVPIQQAVTGQERAAKIHDFCFGIPFGGIVLGGGVVGFIFSRNPATLITGVLTGAALLALSTFSLKVWRQGKSSLPFILGQAVLAATLVWKNFQSYSLTKKLFPTGFNAAISAAMLCFYTYVVISGGNPPPKKLKSSAAVPS